VNEMMRGDVRNNFSTELNVCLADGEARIVCLSKEIGEETSLAFAECCEQIGKYDR
jgi:hypothetical protein